MRLQTAVENIVVGVLLILNVLRTAVPSRFTRDESECRADGRTLPTVSAAHAADQRTGSGADDASTSNRFRVGILRASVPARLLHRNGMAIVIFLLLRQLLLLLRSRRLGSDKAANRQCDEDSAAHQKVLTLSRPIAVKTVSLALAEHSFMSASVALSRTPVLKDVAPAFAAAYPQ